MAGKAPSAAYLRRAELFVQAVDLGIGLLSGVPESEALIKYANEVKDLAYGKYPSEVGQPPGGAKLTVAGLRYLEEAFFTYWHETSGSHVDRFWLLVDEHGLPYRRKDHVAAVLARGRIASRAEYDAVIDNLVVLQQLGKLSPTDFEKLSRAVERYEERQ